MSATALAPARPGATTKQKVGLVLCFLLNLSNIASVLFPTPEGEVGPPLPILVAGTVFGVIGVVATVYAWRGSGVGNRVAAGMLVLEVLSALPAFFVPVPLGVKALVGASVVLTVVTIVLMFSGPRRRADAV